jgi:plastocyanin
VHSSFYLSLFMTSQVQVGPNGQLSYDPSNLAARNGTTVTFLFPP